MYGVWNRTPPKTLLANRCADICEFASPVEASRAVFPDTASSLLSNLSFPLVPFFSLMLPKGVSACHEAADLEQRCVLFRDDSRTDATGFSHGLTASLPLNL